MPMIHQRSRQSDLRCSAALVGDRRCWRSSSRTPLGAQGSGAANEFNDSHFHLTNYIQQGLTPREFLQIMGTRVGRSTLFGIPLQQQWSYANSGDFAPTYYLQSDAPLYYYSFTDAFIASVYRSLTPAEQARFDPMITGFNPADMYGADHIRRVLQTFPGVFSGIGEFSIHKEFVSSKVSGETASLTNPALDRILDFAAEAGLVVILHNDIDMPFAKPDAEPVYLTQMKSLLKRHPKRRSSGRTPGSAASCTRRRSSASSRRSAVRTTSRSSKRCWRIRRSAMCTSTSPGTKWRSTPSRRRESIARVAAMLNKYPDRFLFGTDTVAPASAAAYFAVFDMWDAGLAAADAGSEPQGAERQLRADVRRRPPARRASGSG